MKYGRVLAIIMRQEYLDVVSYYFKENINDRKIDKIRELQFFLKINEVMESIIVQAIEYTCSTLFFLSFENIILMMF